MKKPKLLLILFAFLAFGQIAWAQDQVSVSYVDENGTTQTHNAYKLDEFVSASPSGVNIGNTGFTNWYFVEGNNVVLNGQLGYNGCINLILCDGAKLTVNNTGGNAIQSLDNTDTKYTLTIYVQEQGTGQLVATATGDKAIQTENLTIHGGTISATGSAHGIYAPNSNIIINGGTVTAEAGGNAIEGFNVTINGGVVSATGNGGIKNGLGGGRTTLGYTNSSDDQITATSYLLGNDASSVYIKDGQYMITDNGVIVYGWLNEDKRNAIAGRILSPYTPTEWDGEGEIDDPYIIDSEDDLILLSLRTGGGSEDYTGKYFRLDADLNFTASTNWDNITSPESNFSAISIFDGHFNGNSHTISGLRLHTNYNFTEQKGLFDRLGPNAYIENLTISNARIAGEKQVGAVAGYAQEGATVTNCHVTGTVAVYAYGNTLQRHGGVVGYNQGTISNCVSEVTISRSPYYAYGSEYVGGIAGYNSGTLSGNKVFGANLTAVSHYGAIAGINNEGTLTGNYYRACTVNGTANSTDVGCDGADVTTNDGALSLHTISVPNTVAIMTEPTLTYNTVNYWAQSKEVTLSGGLNDTPTEGWQKAYFVNGTANTGDAYGFTPSDSYDMPATDVTISVGEIHADWATAQSGASNNPYKIYFTDQLDLLSTRVNAGSSYEDAYFKLMDNMEYDNTEANNYTAIGTGDHPFSGHFDGNSKVVSGIRISGSDSYQGIFGSLNGGSVANLFVIDTEISGTSQLGVIAGYNDGGILSNNYYLDCSVNDATTGIGCNGADVTADDGALSLHTITTPNTVTIVTAPIVNYNTVDYWAQGKTVILSGGLNDTPTEGWQKAYFVNGTANTSDAYGFTPSMSYDMPATDVEITVGEIHADWATAQTGESNNPYRIYFTDQLDLLAARVSIGRTYGGKYFKLMDNMEYDRNVPNNYTVIGFGSHPFSGHFDGDGKAISGIRIMGSYQYQGVFGYLRNGSIANLFVQDAVIVSDSPNTGVIAGYNYGGTLANNYYFDCNVNSVTTGIGCGGGDVTVNDGARPVFTLGLASGITASATVTLTHDETNYYKSGTTVTLDATTPPAPGYKHLFIVNSYPIKGNTFDMETNTSVTVELDDIDWETEYAGTEDDPYLIGNAQQWNWLSEHVNGINGGNHYSGKYFKLIDDISVTFMVGGGDESSNVFSGTFDGDGHTITFYMANATEQYIAPFRRIDGATIKGLKVNGSVTSSYRFAGGIVAYAKGTSTVTDCVNSTSITSYGTNENASNGGIVGMVGGNGTINITGCVFNGKMTGVTNSNNTWSGILGLCNSGCTANISDCLVDPADAVTYGNTIYRNGNNATTNCSNCYYTKTIGNAQGKQAYTITGGENVTVENAGTVTSEATIGVTGYSTGIKYEGVLYAGNGDNVSLNLSVPEGYVISGNYSASAGTLNGSSNPYTLTMPNEDVIITADATLTTIYREIEGYGDGNDHWAFIASPVSGSIGVNDVEHLMGNTISTNPILYDFDLYRLNPSDMMWENYHAHTSDFNIVNGMGYLYATKETKTLAFSGTFNTGASKEITDLPAGFNLVGNPFTVDAYVSKPYYKMNNDGSAILADVQSIATPIPPCYGVIVEVGESETVTFNTSGEFSAGPNNGSLKIALSQANTRSNAVMDNAIVSFNEGEQLGKFYFGTQNANIYIPQYGEEYAIASSDKHGEMPLNFKAVSDGTYTLTVNPEGTEMAYLHLIDNLTGADVDLLVEPSYTFTGRTTDYTSRFKLVFVANDAQIGGEGSDDFAFISNGQLIVTGEGTLQIIDMVGRVISTEIVNGTTSKAINAKAGVYVLRLITGENVKTQKIVVR